MKTKVKITLLFLLLCGSCYYVFTKERRSSTEHDQSSKGVSCPRMPTMFEDVKPVITVIGRNITLRCVTNFTSDDILEWIKGNDDILVVKNRKVHQNTDKSRYSLAASIEGLNRSIASLNISHVKHTDSGSYCCCIRNIKNVRQCINHTVDSDKHRKVVPSHFPTTPSPQNGNVLYLPAVGKEKEKVVTHMPMSYHHYQKIEAVTRKGGLLKNMLYKMVTPQILLWLERHHTVDEKRKLFQPPKTKASVHFP
ncbi:uncharacterized protein LOC103131897 isoform X3 [Poecilia formosa]|uniref:uncharacterized protein LOC103131897 isoform X3 n=1 Tax=Poecilia formosa TaxID=48698 RepID=UPI0004444076|nr:PREDICTED: uncharacterized protein LOC103131897 isoform X3 [Poecilia formosa]